MNNLFTILGTFFLVTFWVLIIGGFLYAIHKESQKEKK